MAGVSRQKGDFPWVFDSVLQRGAARSYRDAIGVLILASAQAAMAMKDAVSYEPTVKVRMDAHGRVVVDDQLGASADFMAAVRQFNTLRKIEA